MVLLLGVTTDTQDTTGTVLSEQPVCVQEDKLRTIMEGFVGKSRQIPPMYSALKVNGKKLYELAREGKEVERKPSAFPCALLQRNVYPDTVSGYRRKSRLRRLYGRTFADKGGQIFTG